MDRTNRPTRSRSRTATSPNRPLLSGAALCVHGGFALGLLAFVLIAI